ncbi:hypothetical protein [Candidatus Accumulibacter sp. ACC003]|uniref:hypothetical protein n=1 Tax=Candidatus Accumulibacter sp. ACC003 TaxID=2823334 RepID=UPI0025BF76A8|nr:hypothetical protein [Candidatus Accumulibacter sp. ACC003]
MQTTLTYRHRAISEDDLVFIRQLIADHPGLSRRGLSKRLCEAWNWVQANGALRDMVCRGMMLHREGLIALPPVRRVVRNPLADRRQPARVNVDETPCTLTLSGIDPLLLTKPDPPSRHGCAHENAAHTAIPERTRLYTASRVRCAGLQKPQPALDPAPRRKPGCWRAPTVGQFP